MLVKAWHTGILQIACLNKWQWTTASNWLWLCRATVRVYPVLLHWVRVQTETLRHCNLQLKQVWWNKIISMLQFSKQVLLNCHSIQDWEHKILHNIRICKEFNNHFLSIMNDQFVSKSRWSTYKFVMLYTFQTGMMQCSYSR